MKEKSVRPRAQPLQATHDMDSFISVFHASSLDSQQAPSQPQPQSHQQPQRPASNPYCYIPGQYWQTLDYYDMAMDICADFSDLSQITPSFVPNNRALSFADDLTPLDSPLDFAPEAFSSPGDSLQLARTDSTVQESPETEAECPGHGRCNSQQLPCKICEKDKKEVSPYDCRWCQATRMHSTAHPCALIFPHEAHSAEPTHMQRRKEQNRKAQRNHRLRSEAKLEQLRARVKSQSDEIVMLRDFNQSLLKHIETLESKCKDGGTADTGRDAEEADACRQQPSLSP